MRTPKEYTQNLKDKVITKEMLAVSLFSVNKRAKNCRDKEREYRSYRYDPYENESKCREKKEHYYEQKEKMLSLLVPTCIHKELFKRKVRYYDYECNLDEMIKTHEVIKQGEYYDREQRDYVQFVDVFENDSRYYLYYELGDYSFHTPIYDCEVDGYDLEIKEINGLVTFGKNMSDLISTQFVDKLLQLIEKGDYKLCA